MSERKIGGPQPGAERIASHPRGSNSSNRYRMEIARDIADQNYDKTIKELLPRINSELQKQGLRPYSLKTATYIVSMGRRERNVRAQRQKLPLFPPRGFDRPKPRREKSP